MRWVLVVAMLTAACAGSKPARTVQTGGGVVTTEGTKGTVRPGKVEPALTTRALPALVVEPVLFDFDRALVRADQAATVAQAAAGLKARKRVAVTLTGHCDERGTLEYNLALGMRRAQSVKAALVKAGVKGNRVTCETMGKEEPADLGHDEAAWARNRRCTFTVITE